MPKHVYKEPYVKDERENRDAIADEPRPPLKFLQCDSHPAAQGCEHHKISSHNAWDIQKQSWAQGRRGRCLFDEGNQRRACKPPREQQHNVSGRTDEVQQRNEGHPNGRWFHLQCSASSTEMVLLSARNFL